MDRKPLHPLRREPVEWPYAHETPLEAKRDFGWLLLCLFGLVVGSAVVALLLALDVGWTAAP